MFGGFFGYWVVGRVTFRGVNDEHDHTDLDELRAEYLDALRAWRVRLRVHLEDTHGVPVPGGVDPEVLHQQLHADHSE